MHRTKTSITVATRTKPGPAEIWTGTGRRRVALLRRITPTAYRRALRLADQLDTAGMAIAIDERSCSLK